VCLMCAAAACYMLQLSGRSGPYWVGSAKPGDFPLRDSETNYGMVDRTVCM
jgi:hypothetical protein